MRILFSLYKIDALAQKSSLEMTKWTETDLSIEELDQHFGLTDHFELHVYSGQNITFWDIYFTAGDLNGFISKIETIPFRNSDTHVFKQPVFLRVSMSNPDIDDRQVARKNNEVFLYNYNRYEIGASGISSITCWMSSHPFVMIFIGGAIWDAVKWLFIKLLRIKKQESNQPPIVLRVRRFYRDFSMLTKTKETDCQIVKIQHLKRAEFDITVRTIRNEVYEAHCRSSGAILSLEKRGIQYMSDFPLK